MFNVMCQRKCVYNVKEDISNTCYYLLRKLIFFFFFLIVGLKSWKAKHKTYSLEIHFSHDEQ